MPSDYESSVLPALPAFLSSAPPVCLSSDCIPRQPDADAHLTFRQIPTPNIILSGAHSSKFIRGDIVDEDNSSGGRGDP